MRRRPIGWNPGFCHTYYMRGPKKEGDKMIGFLLWCILFVVCWPFALLILFLLPLIWLIALPFRVAAAVIGGLFSLTWGLLTLPFRLFSCRW